MSETGRRAPSFQSIIERSAELVVLQRADGVPTYISPALRDLLGYAPEELIGRLTLELVHPDDREAAADRFRELCARPGASRLYELRVRRRDGTTRWLECSATNLLEDPEVGAIAATYRDITARKDAEDALVRTLKAADIAQQRLNYLLSATAAVTFTWRATAEFRPTFVSENVVGMLGYAPQQFLDDSAFWMDRVHPEDRPMLHALGTRLFELGSMSWDYRFLHADGRYRWLHGSLSLVREKSGEPREIIGYWVDITARKEAEAALRRSEEMFRNLVEHHPAAMLIHREGRVVRVNAAAVRMLGYASAEELCGRSVLELVPAEDRAAIRARIEASLVSGRALPNEERILRRDGTAVIAEVESLVLPIDGVPSVLVFARDLTERRDLLARMAVADRMVSVGMLAAGVAHEMNTPLAYVLSNLSVLAESVPRLLQGQAEGTRLRPDDVAQLLRDAQDGASRVAAVVRDLRTLSQADQGPLAPTDVAAALETAAKIASHVIRTRAELEASLEPVPRVRATEGRLVQVFLNLLVNAAQAIPEGASGQHRIRLRTRREPGGRVAVDIEDTGSGIAPEVLPRIFEPFFTTKASGEGTGLGLAICQRLVQAFGGDLRVTSALGSGTVVTVSLLEAGEEAQRALATSQPAREGAPPRQLLLVDDEVRFGTSLRLLLAPRYQVQAFTDARAALAAIAGGERYHAVLCDLTMPGMSGMEFHEALRRLRPELAARVVFITGGAFTPRARDFLASTSNLCLEKPVSEAALWKALEQVAG